jgi:hypothetical protein
MITILPAPTDDEAAAVLAAIQYMLDDEALPAASVIPRHPWRESARLLVQNVAPARLPAPTWGNIERLRRMRSRA